MAQAKGVAVNSQKVEELREVVSYGVMSAPGVVIYGKVVHAGESRIERISITGSTPGPD